MSCAGRTREPGRPAMRIETVFHSTAAPYNVIFVILATLFWPSVAAALNAVEPYGAPPVISRPQTLDGVTVMKLADGPYLPQDPSDQGKATVEGVDVDADGVRDDIERYIAYSYPDSKGIREALYLAARAQALKLESTTVEKVLAASQKLINAVRCLSDELGDSFEAYRIEKELRIQYLNTLERLQASRAVDKVMNGQFVRIDSLPCDWGDSR